MSGELGLEEALDIAMDAELRAQAFYALAAVEVQDAHGRDLLGRLAAFEGYHYQKLVELAQSLHDQGRFIEYRPRTIDQFAPTDAFPLAGSGETGGTVVDELGDVPAILSKAIENEKVAGDRYRALAEGTADPDGKAMFRRLSDEELIHRRILEDEFFSLSNQGVWAWSGMYGE